jgi:hypothetical protein
MMIEEESIEDYLQKTDENMAERELVAKAVSRYAKFLVDKRERSYEETRGHVLSVALDTFNHCYSPGCSGAQIWFRVGNNE